MDIDRDPRTTGPLRLQHKRRGALLVLVATMMVVIFAFVGLMVDGSWMALAKTEQQFAVDEAARASLMYLATSPSSATGKPREQQAIRRGQRMFREDVIGGRRQLGVSATIELGHARWGEDGSVGFSPWTRPYDAARAVSDANSGTLSPVGLFFAKMFGLDAFRPRSEGVVAVAPIDLVLCIDASGSMCKRIESSKKPPGSVGDEPIAGSRWFDLIDATTLFVDSLERNKPFLRVGLVALGGGGPEGAVKDHSLPPAVVEVELVGSARYDEIPAVLPSYKILGLQGSTDLTAGIRESLRLLERDGRGMAEQYIALLSDGEQYTPHYTTDSPETAAAEASAAGITVHTMLIGTDDAADQLRRIADAGGGDFFGQARSREELIRYFEELLQSFPIRLVD